MTKEELREGFHQGFALADMLELVPGQDCMMFKAENFRIDDEVVYIPDMCLNNITAYRPPECEDVQYTLDRCYTGRDFVELCNGNRELALRLFKRCDWQHPSTELLEMEMMGE